MVRTTSEVGRQYISKINNFIIRSEIAVNTEYYKDELKRETKVKSLPTATTRNKNLNIVTIKFYYTGPTIWFVLFDTCCSEVP